ncbi:hypothetical protein F4680DRAFT_282032 [Xylaria scruposa]|nr:hypothetical protein F4860DRAFT_195823 [Xylaria cubensis]KAI1744110.1 hypothetical protein F4680DRAFT_282032 [Xylaria scruposa]
MSADGHGLPDNAIRGAHDMIHHAEQEEHEHEAAQKRGLTDQAVEAEHEFMEHQEDELAKLEKGKKGSGLKKKLEKMLPGHH